MTSNTSPADIPGGTTLPVHRSRFLSFVLIFFLFAPVFAHTITFLTTSFVETITFDKVDLWVFVGVVLYLSAAVVMAYHRKGLPKFLLLTYSVLMTVGSAELLLRSCFPQALEDTPWIPGTNVGEASDTMPGIDGKIVVSVNELGLRGPQVNLDDCQLRILCVGGSTTECAYVTDERSWPWYVQDKLTKELGIKVFVGNAGRSGHMALHHEYLLRHYSPVEKFDWVVVLCGINDAGSFWRDNYHQRQDHVAHETFKTMKKKAYYRQWVLMRMLRKNVVETVVQDRAGEWYKTVRKNRQEALKRKTFDKLPPGMHPALHRYAVDLRRVILACRAQNLKLVMITQPTIYRDDLSPELQELLWQYSPEGAYTPGALAKMMERFNQTMLEVCREENVDCIDLASRLAKDTTVFYDDAHFNQQGCQQVGDIVGEYFREKLGRAMVSSK